MRVDTISVLLDRYGQCVTLYRGGVEAGREVRAFLQPLREAGREQARPSPLGLRREDRYLMLGEPDVPAAPGDRVVWRESGYEVRTAHPIYLGERLSPASSSAALTAALAGVEQHSFQLRMWRTTPLPLALSLA